MRHFPKVLAVAMFSLASVASAQADIGSPPAQSAPMYSYAIESKSFRDAGVFSNSMHLVIPSTVWICDLGFTGLKVDHSLALLARCAAYASTGRIEVITRVSCSSADQDAATVHLSTLDDEKRFASVYIACRRDVIDDGF